MQDAMIFFPHSWAPFPSLLCSPYAAVKPRSPAHLEDLHFCVSWQYMRSIERFLISIFCSAEATHPKWHQVAFQVMPPLGEEEATLGMIVEPQSAVCSNYTANNQPLVTNCSLWDFSITPQFVSPVPSLGKRSGNCKHTFKLYDSFFGWNKGMRWRSQNSCMCPAVVTWFGHQVAVSTDLAVFLLVSLWIIFYCT